MLSNGKIYPLFGSERKSLFSTELHNSSVMPFCKSTKYTLQQVCDRWALGPGRHYQKGTNRSGEVMEVPLVHFLQPSAGRVQYCGWRTRVRLLFVRKSETLKMKSILSQCIQPNKCNGGVFMEMHAMFIFIEDE